jgi:CPA2 family monovalent cation:H+ antiporter-2
MAPWIVGLGLSQIGEFSFVLARTGYAGGSISKEVYDLSLTCTVLTMGLAPVVSSLALPIGRLWRKYRKPAPVHQDIVLPQVELRDHVIVGGFGRTGRAAGEALHAAGVLTVIVEANHDSMADITACGAQAIYGDIASEEILHAAHVEHAKILLLTMPDRNTIHLAIERARRMNADLPIVARALRERHVDELQSLGITAAVQPEFEGGIEMVRQALVRSGRDPIEVSLLTSQLRRNLYHTVPPELS